MICTRLDIAYAVRVVSRYMSNFSKKHREAVKGIMRYVNGTRKSAFALEIEMHV